MPVDKMVETRQPKRAKKYKPNGKKCKKILEGVISKAKTLKFLKMFKVIIPKPLK